MSKLVSSYFAGRRHDDAITDRAHRILAGIAWLFACSVSSLSFIVMGWTAAQCTIHIAHIYVYGLMLAAVVQFIFAMVALLRGLDDLFYQKDDRRRLTRRSNDR